MAALPAFSGQKWLDSATLVRLTDTIKLPGPGTTYLENGLVINTFPPSIPHHLRPMVFPVHDVDEILTKSLDEYPSSNFSREGLEKWTAGLAREGDLDIEIHQRLRRHMQNMSPISFQREFLSVVRCHSFRLRLVT